MTSTCRSRKCTTLAKLVALALASSALPAHGEGWRLPVHMPSAWFVQAGIASNDAQSCSIGALWDWRWQRSTRLGTFGGYSEAAVGRWVAGGGQSASSLWATQVGMTPVIRFRPASVGSRWFVEAGIGANLIVPIYHSGGKSFSTEFNFGDHLAVGHTLGAARRLSFRG